MRALIFTAGICLAATAATAGSDDDFVSRGNIALANGCVYSPHPSGQADAWSLAYTKSGTTARCAQFVKAQVTKASTVTRSKTSLSLNQSFATGVFR